MSISIIGIVLLLYIGRLILKRQNAGALLVALFSLNFLYEGFINLGYFISIGGQVFKVPDFIQLITVIVALSCMRGKMSARLCIFILAILTSLILIELVPYNEMVRSFNALDRVTDIADYMHYPSIDVQAIKTTLRMICFAVNGYVISLIISRHEWETILNKYLKCGRILFMYVWLEFVLKNIFHTNAIQNILNFIFGASETSVSSLYRNGLRVLQGFNNEPSQFTMMVFSYWLIFVLTKSWGKINRKDLWITFSSAILVLLSGSFRVVGLIPIVVLLYLIVSEKPAYSIVITTVAAVTLAVMDTFGYLDYYFNRLNNSLMFLKTGDYSIAGGEAGRLYTISEAFKVFMKRPIFGIGPGQTFAYGFIPSILAMTGIVGMLSWYNVVFSDIGRINIKRKKGILLLSVFIISFAWIYTDSIAVAYSIYVIGIALAIRFNWDNIVIEEN